VPKEKISKQDLIAKSIDVFWKKGYYRTSMADLATACGLTKGAFYHHYKSKEEVMMNCLVSTSDMFEDKIFSIAYKEEYTALEKLNKMADVIYYAFTKENGGCYFANTILETVHIEATFIDVIKDFFSRWEAAMVEIFSSNHSESEAKELSLKSIADIEGSIILMLLHSDTSYLKNALNRSIESY
tara:strand:- start:4203 stop:4757 length:555 start_codon:yes stop_codon:yes gene_type:complete